MIKVKNNSYTRIIVFCPNIMELTVKNERYINGNNEIIDIEDDMIFPLIKSSMFKEPIIKNFKKNVIITQTKIREDTAKLKEVVPKTWDYLNHNYEKFDSRKSSIYKNSPPFSIFGIGDYSFAKYKVGISGFYKKPLFSVLYSLSGKPVMTDDTCYFLSFNTYEDAYTVMLYLNTNKVQEFLKSIVFIDNKRPYTKKVLQRIDLNKVVNKISLLDLKNTEAELGLKPFINDKMIKNIKKIL